MSSPPTTRCEDHHEDSDGHHTATYPAEADLKHRGQPKRKPKPKPVNPIATGILLWLDNLPQAVIDIIITRCSSSRDELKKELVGAAPKRWVVYHPMVLLPAGSFSAEVWEDLLSVLDERQKGDLWERVLGEFGRKEGVKAGEGTELSRLAVNEGIPAVQKERRAASGEGEEEGGEGGEEGEGNEEEERDNIIRAPTNLRILHGDFGPEPTPESRRHPTDEDFTKAFWVHTKQNGIYQTWAPRYTMFSRGNIKEKARLLDFHQRADRKLRNDAFAVDLYAGIGYFVFSYAKLGMRVLCWEINPWSVEALRRGAGMNGRSIKVVSKRALDGACAVEHVYGGEGRRHRIVVFPEDNSRAYGRICDELQRPNSDDAADIVHVNCGLLPSSTPTWRGALEMVSKPEGWLHLHENVGATEIESRRREIEALFAGWLAEDAERRKAVVEHVEKVKTYAPGVWHCVFDVHITWPPDIEEDPVI